MTEAAGQTRLVAAADSTETVSDDELIARYIVRSPNGAGPDQAQTVSGVSVWALIGYMRGEGNSVARTAEAYGLPDVAVLAALAYYRQHRALIDARLLLHDAYFNED